MSHADDLTTFNIDDGYGSITGILPKSFTEKEKLKNGLIFSFRLKSFSINFFVFK